MILAKVQNYTLLAMHRFWSYSRLVFAQWRILFAFAAFIVRVGAEVRGQQILLPNWAWLLVLAVSLYYATFNVYCRTLDERPKVATLELSLDAVRMAAGGWSAPWPNHPNIVLTLTLTNKGDEKAKVTALEILECDLKMPALNATPARTKWRRTGLLLLAAMPGAEPVSPGSEEVQRLRLGVRAPVRVSAGSDPRAAAIALLDGLPQALDGAGPRHRCRDRRPGGRQPCTPHRRAEPEGRHGQDDDGRVVGRRPR